MLEVVEAGGLITIQDKGRVGWRRYGVPASGPMDEMAFIAANLLVGNAAEEAEVEIGGGDLRLQASSDCVIAASGAGYELSVNEWSFPLWGSYFVRRGWAISLQTAGAGMWAYLAIAGGFEATTALGSQSTYMRGHFGGVEGRVLQAGDTLKVKAASRELMEVAERMIAVERRPAYSESPTVEIIMGPQRDRFPSESIEALLSNPYRIAAVSDRMGYRLEGRELRHNGGADLTSEGMTPGAIQVPADGAPIVMMADCATTGGYPKIGCVIRADLPLLAQCRPGKDEVHFSETTVEAAQEKYAVAMRRVHTGLMTDDEATAMGAA